MPVAVSSEAFYIYWQWYPGLFFRQGDTLDVLRKAPPHVRRRRRGGKNHGGKRKNWAELGPQPTTVRICKLSKHPLNLYEISLLSKGLSFAPTIGPNFFELFRDLNRFIILLMLERHFLIPGKHGGDQSWYSPIAIPSQMADYPLHQNVIDTLRELNCPTKHCDIPCSLFLPPDRESGEEVDWLAVFVNKTIQHRAFKRPSTFYPHESKGLFIPAFYWAV